MPDYRQTLTSMYKDIAALIILTVLSVATLWLFASSEYRILIIGFTVLAWGGWIWWKLPIVMLSAKLIQADPTPSSKEQLELENEYRKTVAQALAAVVVIVSVVLTYLQIRETGRNTDLNNSNQQLATAFGLLGNDSAVERSGGIQLLERWANEQVDQEEKTKRNDVLMPSLLNFVRDQIKFEDNKIKSEFCEVFASYRPESLMITDDVRQAIKVINERSTQKRLSLPFRGLNISRVSFVDANFMNSQIAFSDLSQANIIGVNLSGSDLYCANLYEAKIYYSDFSSGGKYRGRKQTNLAGALLVGADLRNTSLRGANLVSANFTGANLENVDLRGANLFNAKFYKAKLKNIRLDDKTNFDSTCFVGAEIPDNLRSASNFTLAVDEKSRNDLDPSSHCSIALRIGSDPFAYRE
jgi:poly-beta-1,6-N-acetyl-D-glucosamine biosynthesis protein PgaD